MTALAQQQLGKASRRHRLKGGRSAYAVVRSWRAACVLPGVGTRGHAVCSRMR